MLLNLFPYSESNEITPVELLNRCKKGECPRYEHDIPSDKLQNELNILANNYKQNINIKSKKEILLKEREILFQELKHPELTLARNYRDVRNAMPTNIKGKEYTDALKLFSLVGLSRLISIGDFCNKEMSADEINILKDVYIEFDENTKTGLSGKNCVFSIISNAESYSKDVKGDLENVLDFLYENTDDKDLKNKILYCKDDNNVEELFNNLKEDTNNYDLLRQVLIHSKVNDEKVIKYINNILSSDNVSPDIMRAAVWGAGKFRSDENFEIIKNIALDKDEEDIRKREFAIHSTALYLREKPAEVNEIMDKIKEDGTIFSPLARIIKDKINGNYHGQENREIKYAGLTKEEELKFNKEFKKFVVPDKMLTIREKNDCYRSVMPFAEYLPKINDKSSFNLADDTFTKYCPDLTGQRRFERDSDLSYSGDYVDTYDGVHMGTMNFLNLGRVKHYYQSSVMSHELGHLLEEYCHISGDVSKLYNNAMGKKAALNDYAETGSSEYFACGCDAYVSVYIPHFLLLKNHIGAHSRYELMDKDKDLYDYIENLMKRD